MPVSWPRAAESSVRTCQLGRISPGREALGRTRWRRPSGWVTRAVFLGVGLEREDDVGLGGGLVLEHREGDHVLGGAEGRGPGAGVGEVAQRVDAEEDQGLQLAGLKGRADLLGALAVWRLAQGPVRRPGGQPTSRRPRALVTSGTSSRPEPSFSASSRAEATSSRACRAPSPSRPIRSPQTIDDALGASQQLGDR